MLSQVDWDDTLGPQYEKEWDDYKQSLLCLQQLQIPRVYISFSAVSKQVLIFADASESAIAAVAYMQATDTFGNQEYGFVLGKAKLAPSHGHTVPRLELCAAVLATEIAEMISDELDIELSTIRYFSDSKVVLGYLNNQRRRFYVYVTNRVERIRRVSSPQQWNYVPTHLNPADVATRGIPAADIQASIWLNGPQSFLPVKEEPFDLRDPEDDREIRPEVTTLQTKVSEGIGLKTHRFQRFSSWKKLIRAVCILKHITRSFAKQCDHHGWHRCKSSRNVELHQETAHLIVREVQREVYTREIDCIMDSKVLPKDSSIRNLSPFLDSYGILRIGGRLNRAKIPKEGKNPILLPGKHHVATLLARHYHEDVQHQGRHFTEGAIRAAGYWITGCKRLVSSMCHQCIKCRKLRAKTSHQKMSDLPTERLLPAPPFTYVGLDTFGHWDVVTRRTRGGTANNKRWAILFTCLVTRAVHIEVVEEMTSSAFINALRRFQAIRGSVKQFRSDRGTNFIGATEDLGIETINVEDGKVIEYLHDRGIQWIFNPPHSSHMGGSWERMIGVARRILDSMLLDMRGKGLTHDVLVTFMAEVCAIINSRPLVPVSSDPDSPFILTPNTLLTQKSDYPKESLTDTTKRDLRDIYKSQWRHVQVLADNFWKRWRNEYLHTLQTRRKWQDSQPNIKEGDLILLKDDSIHRHDWRVGVITKAVPGSDGKVRTAVVRVAQEDQIVSYTRPVTQMVHLLSAQ